MFPTKRSIRPTRFLKFLFGCLLCVCITVWCLFLFGHHILCHFHDGLCTPLVYWYRRMPIQYDPPTLHGIHPIDAEWDKANANLACNLSSDALDNTIFLDLQQPSEFQDPTYDPLSQGEQEKLHAQYSKIPVTKR
eukprot:406805_1